MSDIGDFKDMVRAFVGSPASTAASEQPYSAGARAMTGTVMPCGACVTNVYDAYSAGRKAAASEQQAGAVHQAKVESGNWKYIEADQLERYSDVFTVRTLYAAPDIATTAADQQAIHLADEGSKVASASLMAAPGVSEALAEMAADQQGDTAWRAVCTVGDMVHNLLTLDQASPIYTAFHVDIGGKRRCRTRPVTISRERVIDGKWIDSSRKDVPYAHVVWARPNEGAAQAQAGDHPTWDDVQARERDIRALQSRVIELEGAAQAQAGESDGEIYARYVTDGLALDARDAGRYRWLRNEAWGGHVMSKKFPHVVEYGPGLMRSSLTELAEEALDNAIDEAIAAMASPATSGGGNG